ncbi:MAG TPA: trypsin-like peptidase domain-containing protein [Burkholderiales bacterium]
MRLNKCAITGALAAGVLCGLPSSGAQDLSALYDSVAPAIVVIREEGSLGSGFIVSADGKIATNAHVIMNMNAGSVKLQSGEEYGPFKVLGIDLKRDLAVIEIRASGLPKLALRDSDTVRAGNKVLVLGAPIGLEGTLTSGVVSSIRPFMGSSLIQTDAAVNPGSSGGPMLDTDGRVIGIVSSGIPVAAKNIGFAIPANALRSLLDNLRDSWTPSEMRDLLKAGIDWVDMDSALFPTLWRRQEQAAYLQLQVSDARIVGTAVLPDELTAAGFAYRYAIEKRQVRWQGVLQERRPCLSGTHPLVVEKVCSLAHEVQMTLITRYRIEGRHNVSAKEAEFDCRRCRWSGDSSWVDFVWVPAGGVPLEESATAQQ